MGSQPGFDTNSLPEVDKSSAYRKRDHFIFLDIYPDQSFYSFDLIDFGRISFGGFSEIGFDNSL